MRPARPFVSDGVYSRFSVQLALMRGEDRRNVMQDAHVLSVDLEGVESAAPLDVTHLRVRAAARDIEVRAGASQDEIARALSRASAESYVEIWSLVRRHGATTTREASALGSACTSCGAPILDAQTGRLPTLGEMIKCRYCGALLCSGEHDWVLAEITQLEEWHPGAAPTPAGFQHLRQRDPELSRESIEDRASYLFWKWIEAGRLRSVAPLRKGATPREPGRRGGHRRRARGRRRGRRPDPRRVGRDGSRVREGLLVGRARRRDATDARSVRAAPGAKTRRRHAAGDDGARVHRLRRPHR
jgi:hypothetical protein